MRNKLAVMAFGLVFLAGCLTNVPYDVDDPRAGPPDEGGYGTNPHRYRHDMDFADFYDYLAPHGVWVSYRPYGYVWVPRHVGYRWRPYSSGRWLWTDYGWTWIAREEWGWVPFHYGRWSWDRSLGWFWVPGTVWAPAWVTWRWGDIYIGWAPLPPDADFVPGMGIHGPYHLHDDRWVFVEGRDFQHDRIDRYALPYEKNPSALRFSVHKSELAARDREVHNEGVDIEDVRRLTRTAVSRHELEDADGPDDIRVGERSVRIFRPAVKKNESARPKSSIDQTEAEKDLPKIREKELDRNGGSEPAAARLKEDQDREMRILERSQEVEKEALKRRVEADEQKAETPAEKEKAAKEGEVKAGELRKTQEGEKAKVGARHEEEKKTLKGTIRKKEGA